MKEGKWGAKEKERRKKAKERGTKRKFEFRHNSKTLGNTGRGGVKERKKRDLERKVEYKERKEERKKKK